MVQIMHVCLIVAIGLTSAVLACGLASVGES